MARAEFRDGPHLPHHVRDEIASIEQLPPCRLPDVARDEATRATLATYPAMLWIPGLERAELIEGPEPAWHQWTWSTWEHLLVYVDRDPDLPRLAGLKANDPSHCRLMAGGSPMRVRRFAPGDPAWAGEGFAGEV